MSKTMPPNGPGKDALKKNEKKNARIGFIESTGDSGYDNRTDPKYCFDILKKFTKKNASGDTELG